MNTNTNASQKPNARKGTRKTPEQIGRDAYLVRLLEDARRLVQDSQIDGAIGLINRTIWELKQSENKGDWAAQKLPRLMTMAEFAERSGLGFRLTQSMIVANCGQCPAFDHKQSFNDWLKIAHP